MFMMTSRRTVRRASAALIALSFTVGTVLVTGTGAHADPRQYQALAGFGSEVTQGLGNAWAGFHNGINYGPLQTSVASGQRQLVSWDATPAGQCIATRPGAPTILRPTGSVPGLQLLSLAFAGGLWPPGPADPCGNRSASGLVEFVRSDIGPSAVGADLTYIPFARDRVTFAAVRPAGAPVATLTTAQLLSLYTSGPQLVGGVTVLPCAIPRESTTSLKLLGTTPSPGTAVCDALASAPLAENDVPGLVAKAGSLAGATDPVCDGVAGGPAVSCATAQVIAPYLVSAYVSRANGVEAGSVSGATLGALGGPAPTLGAAPNLFPNPAFSLAGAFSFDVYNVVATEVLLPPIDVHVAGMFVGPSSATCAPSLALQRFGFVMASNCGSTLLTGPFITS